MPGPVKEILAGFIHLFNLYVCLLDRELGGGGRGEQVKNNGKKDY